MDSRDFLSHDIKERIESTTCRFLDHAQEALQSEGVDDMHDVYEWLADEHIDDTLGIGMDLDERLTIAETYADDYGLELGDVTLDNLRTQIESLAVLVLHQIGLEEAQEHLRILEEEMEDQGLALSQLCTENSYGWVRHYAERDEGRFHVYEYRNIEGEQIHVDLWEYHAIAGYRFYFAVPLDPEDVTPEENFFDSI